MTQYIVLERTAQIILCLIVFAQYVEHLRFMPLTITQVFGFVLLFVFMLERKLWRRPDPALKYLIMFWCVYVVSTLMYLEEIPGFEKDAILKITSFLQFIILYYLSYSLFSKGQTQRYFVFTIFMSSILISFLGLLNVGVTERHGRFSFGGLDENAMASLIGLGVITAFHYLSSNSRVLIKIIIVIGILCLSWFLVMTASRGGMFAAGIGILAYIVRSRRFVFGLIGLIIVAKLLLQLGPETTAYQRWQSTFESGDLAEREWIFRESIELIKERPFLGRGDVNSYYALGIRTSRFEAGHHNEILWMFNSTGIIGGLLLILAGCKIFRAAWSERELWRSGLSMGLLAFISVSSMSIEIHHRKVIWILLAFLVSSKLPIHQQNKSDTVRQNY